MKTHFPKLCIVLFTASLLSSCYTQKSLIRKKETYSARSLAFVNQLDSSGPNYQALGTTYAKEMYTSAKPYIKNINSTKTAIIILGASTTAVSTISASVEGSLSGNNKNNVTLAASIITAVLAGITTIVSANNEKSAYYIAVNDAILAWESSAMDKNAYDELLKSAKAIIDVYGATATFPPPGF